MKPYETIRWQGRDVPEEALLRRSLEREGWTPVLHTYDPATPTEEVKPSARNVLAVISGQIQVSFPGYGVVALNAGDQLEIEPDALHDVRVLGSSKARVLLGAEG